jgi:uncharacterized lipoprotein
MSCLWWLSSAGRRFGSGESLPLEKSVTLSHSFDEVWDAAVLVLQEAGWKVTQSDSATGGLEVKVIMDSLTWTETFYVNLSRINHDHTRVLIGRIGLSQPLDWGIARQYIDSFLVKLEASMKSTV